MGGGGSFSSGMKYKLQDSSLNMTIPQDASVALSLCHCGFFAALLAQNGASPAQQIITSLEIFKQMFNATCVWYIYI